MSRATSEERFGRTAQNYLDSPAHKQTDRLAALAQRVGQKGGIVADVGTGAGHSAVAFAELADKVLAVDPTQEMLDIVKANSPANVEPVKGHAEQLPIEDNSVDGVTTRLAAHHFEDIDKFLAESARVLKPGGWFLINDIIGPEDVETCEQVNHVEAVRDPSHRWCHPGSWWLTHISDAGFHVEWVEFNSKRLDLEDWLQRQEVSPEVFDEVVNTVMTSTGRLRSHFQPLNTQPKLFHLLEMTLLARLD
jgi:SAM-dependent methyltransferase